MSSDSNLSWCTADNEPDECIQFLDDQSENFKRLNFRVSYAVESEFRPQKTTAPTENDRNVRELDVEVQQNTEITGCCRCCKNSLKIIRRVKGLYTLKMPWIIILLSVVQVIVYFVACNESIALLIFKPQKKYDLWRFITYHSIHMNLTHLLLNVALQVLIALPLEMSEGHIRVLLVFLVGVICGAIGSLCFNPTQSILGSSGGVYSLLFSHISQCTLNWTQISHRTFRLVAVSMLFLSDVLFLILKHIYWSNIEPKISFTAHICGGLAGLLTALIIFKRRKNPRNSLQSKQ